MPNSSRILSIDPTAQGFAFAVIEDGSWLVEAEVVRPPKHDIEIAIERFEALLKRLEPSVLVLEDFAGTKRSAWSKLIARRFKRRAKKHGLSVDFVSREEVRSLFRATGFTKHLIATEIAKRFPELHSRLPGKRRPWEPEAESMGIFDAVSFGLTAIFKEPTIDF